MPNIDEAIEALLAYRQADMEGVMVLTSRQAIHEVADELKRLREPARSSAGIDSLREEIGKALYVRNHGPNPDWPIGVDKLGYQQEPYVKHVPAWEWFHGGDADAVLSVIHGVAQPST